MTVSFERLPEDVRGRIDEHLDAVEQVMLKAGASRQERRSVEEDLRAQILEQLGARCGGRTPGVGDAEAVVAGLDSAESYGQVEVVMRSGPEGTGLVREPDRLRPRLCAEALWSFLLIVVGVCLTIGVVAAVTAANVRGQGAAWATLMADAFLCVVAFVLSIAAFRRIRRSEGALTGRGFALIGFVTPFVFAAGVWVLWMWTSPARRPPGGHFSPSPQFMLPSAHQGSTDDSVPVTGPATRRGE